MKEEIVLKEESYQVVGACFEVYKELGSGFLEAVYQEALSIELSAQQIPYEEKPTLRLNYKGTPLRQTYEPDFVCFNAILIEIKATSQLADEHRAKVINYLSATRYRLGLLINFGAHPKLEHERILSP